MKFTEFLITVLFAAALTLVLLYSLIDNNQLCGWPSEGHRQCVVVVERHE